MINRDRDYQRVLAALLLSNQNKSLRISKINLDVDFNDYKVKINDDHPSGDWIISIEKVK